MPSLESLRDASYSQSLFEDKTWRHSPVPLPLSSAQIEEIHRIGAACLAFYHAQELLYQRSAQRKRLLRNGGDEAPWVAEYLDRGKPEGLVAHGRSRAAKGQVPLVLRPDLLLTDDGFTMTEMDSVPGGVGLAAFLNRLYAPEFPGVVGGDGRQIHLFHQALRSLAPPASKTAARDDEAGAGEARAQEPRIAIVVSAEASTYRPEFEWLASELRAQGHPVFCVAPEDILASGNGIYIPVNGAPERIDVLYRFFELFDLGNVRGADAIFDAVEAGHVAITPPMKAFQEEKLNLALVHHPALADFWRENLPACHLETIRRTVPRTWIMEDVALPPVAVLHAPFVNNRPIRAWGELANAAQKERNLIIKASGFHETAWGARSVVLGSDVSREEWLAAIEDAIDGDNETLHVLQDYHKPRRITHPVFRADGTLENMEGRVRLCPYYFAQRGSSSAELGAILATICPADKKIIHGMKDAAMLPCMEV
ncbi:MAG: hypothetical protein LBG65_05255 [Puniceicoccales bacterium]|jgi:hypothetical protein|nr:hypothetical protein [Puniceicoccales bacterium]